MPSRHYPFEPGGPPRLTLSWGLFWKNFTVSMDGAVVGTIESGAALKEGRGFPLPDGSRVEIRLDQGFGKADLLVARDGRPLPGAAGDPEEQVKVASGILYFIAGLNVVLGVVGMVSGSELLASIGLGWGSALVGVFYAVLGWATRRWRSRVALGLGIGLFALDGLLGVVLTVGAGGTPPVGGLIVRIFLILPMVRAFPALALLQQREAERPKPTGLPGGDDPKNPFQVTPPS